MTGIPSGVGRDGRLAPIVLHDGIVIPGELCAEVSAALELLEAFVCGTPPPAACRSPRLSRVAIATLVAAREAAVQHRRRETQRAHAAASVAPVAVLAPAQTPALSSQEELTTEQVAVILGVTTSRVRQLAAAGRVPGRKTARDVWLFDPEAVRAYQGLPRRNTSHADPDPERAPSAGAA